MQRNVRNSGLEVGFQSSPRFSSFLKRRRLINRRTSSASLGPPVDVRHMRADYVEEYRLRRHPFFPRRYNPIIGAPVPLIWFRAIHGENI